MMTLRKWVKSLSKDSRSLPQNWIEDETKILILLIYYFRQKKFPANHKETVFYMIFREGCPTMLNQKDPGAREKEVCIYLLIVGLYINFGLVSWEHPLKLS